MYNLLITIAVTIVVVLAAGFGLGSGQFNIWYAIFPGVLAFGITYFLLARRTFKMFEQNVLQAQKVFEQRDLDGGIKILEEARPLGKWQFLIDSQIDAQIGSVYFLTKNFKKAEPYLKRGYIKNWMAKAQLGVLYFKHREYDKMVEAFEEAVRSNKKQPLLWNVYAYCQWDRGLNDEALAILNRAKEAVPDDEKTKVNIKAIQNKRRMKMRGWDMNWYQFHLDRPPVPQFQQPQPRFRG